MKRKYCKECDKDTLHNPLKKAKPSDEQLYRCTQCGFPKRYGMAKNSGLRVGGKIIFLGPNAAA